MNEADHAVVAIDLPPVVGAREQLRLPLIRPVGPAHIDDVDRAVLTEREKLRGVLHHSDLHDLRSEVVRLADRADGKDPVGTGVPCGQGVVRIDADEERLGGEQDAVFDLAFPLAPRLIGEEQAHGAHVLVGQVYPI